MTADRLFMLLLGILAGLLALVSFLIRELAKIS